MNNLSNLRTTIASTSSTVTTISPNPSSSLRTTSNNNKHNRNNTNNNKIVNEQLINSDKVDDNNSSNNKSEYSSITLNAQYRCILENLLKLKQDLVTNSIKQAIKGVLLQHKTATSDDWIRVIFKSFEFILSTINVNHIYVNEEYLNEVLKFLASIIETGKVLELIQDKKATNDFNILFNKKMTTILNAVSAEAIYKNATEVFNSNDRSAYVNTLELLKKSLSMLQPTRQNALTHEQITIWYNSIIPLVFDNNPQIQDTTISAVSKLIPFLLISRHQAHIHWTKLKHDILTKYIKEINSLLLKNSPKWYILWCHFVRILDVEIPRSATILNAFLGAVEPALRSYVPIRRAEGYLCWRVLLEVLVKHKRLDSAKRLKLVCTPLKSLQAKTVEIAVNKFQAWWYVLCNVRDNLDVYNEMVFEPFLQFCFGPLRPQPEITAEVTEFSAQVKRFKNVSLMAIATLIRMLGATSPEIDALFTQYSLEKLDRCIVNNIIFQNDVANLIINACGEATQMLCNLTNDSNNANYTGVDIHVIAEKLWTNLLEHINISKNIQHIHLILENMKQLIANADKSQGINKKAQFNIILTVANVVIKSVYLFSPIENDPEMIEKRIKKGVAFLKLIEPISYLEEKGDEFIHAILTLCDSNPFVDNNIFVFYIQKLFDGIFMPDGEEEDVTATDNDSQLHIKFRIWTELATDILCWYNKNFACIKQLDKEDLSCVIEATFNFMYWPLRVMIDMEEVKIFIMKMFEITGFLAALDSKKDLCVQSAAFINQIMSGTTYCRRHINEVIAELIKNYDYDYENIDEAPTEIFDLIKTVVGKENKTCFQDLNPIAKAIIEYYNKCGKKKLAVIEAKLKELMSLIAQKKKDLRVDISFITEFNKMIDRKEKIENGEKDLTTPKAALKQNTRSVIKVATNQNPRNSIKKSLKTESDTDFVVVKKVWTLQPNRLTDHQREKMKERRCDIPALYNDMSQSQDSASIHEWAPKVMAVCKTEEKKIDLKGEDETKEKLEISNKEETVEIKPTKSKSIKTSPKNHGNLAEVTTNGVNKKETNTEPSTDKCDNDKLMPEEKSTNKKRKFDENQEKTDEEEKYLAKKVARELSRIQINAVDSNPTVDPTTKRSTRSAAKVLSQDDNRRKTRSGDKTENNKANDSPPNQTKLITNTRSQASNASHSDSEVSSTEEISLSQSKVETPSSREVPMSLRTRRRSVCTRLHNENGSESGSETESKRIRKTLSQTQEKPNKALNESKSKTQNKNKQEVVKASKDKENLVSEVSMSSKENDEADPLIENEKEENVSSSKTSFNEPVKTEEPKTETPHIIIDPDVENPVINVIECPAPAVMNSPHAHMNGAESLATNEIMEADVPDKKLSNEESPIKCLSEISAKTDQFLSPPIDKSYMSVLMYDENSLHVTNNSINQSILTSPRVDNQRNLDFLNDTINISPIVPDIEQSSNTLKQTEPKCEESVAVLVKSVNGDSDATEQNQAVVAVKDNNIAAAPSVAALAETSSNDDSKHITNASTSAITPIVTTPMPSKQYRTSMHASTPLASNNSPVSSKFKSPLMGRGAQLLKMINTNKTSSEASSPSTSSPTISQLQTAPINDNVSSPEPNLPLKIFPHRANAEFLTFSSVLPSPYESPGVSILKRRAPHGDDDSICSPAHKRKRVSFNFPLSETKEYIVEEEFVQVNTTPTHAHSASQRENSMQYNSPANRLKNKLKRKNRSDSVKDIAKFTKPKSIELDSYTPHKIMMDDNEDEVSVENIKKYLEMDRQKVENENVAPMVEDDTEPDHDEQYKETDKPEPASLASFSDEEIFEHIFNKFSIEDILQRYEQSNRTFETQSVHFLSTKLSSIMSEDENAQAIVLGELAEKHSSEFLDHALTENLCSTVCDRLMISSEDSIIGYMTEKMNSDTRFSTQILNRLKSDVLMQHVLNELDIENQQKLCDHLFDIVDKYHKNKQPIYKLMKQKLPEHLHKVILKILSENRLSVEQFEEYTKLYIFRKFSKESL